MDKHEYDITQEDIFDYQADDEALGKSLNRSITESRDWFDKDPDYQLTDTRKNNKKLWLGKHSNASEMYDYELVNGKPYVDNRIFVSTEAVISYVFAQIPNPEAYAAGDTDTSQQLADDVAGVVKAYFRDNRIMLKAKVSGRHLLNDRVGWFKWRFDPNIGEHGDIVCEPVNPSKLIVDHNATLWDNPRFIAEELEDTVSEIIKKFPDAKKKFMDKQGWTRMSAERMDVRIKYYEVHFTDMAKSQEIVCWLYKNLVFGKMTDPNWNKNGNNFLQTPTKPYVNLNWINTGDHMIDETTMAEQAETLQYTINSRGRQINDNANRTNPTKVFSGDAMDANNASSLTGAPDEAVILKKGSVRDGFTYVQSPQLPQQVYADKIDQRNEVDNIFRTPGTMRGEQQQGSATLGELQMVRAGAQGGLDDLIRAVDDFMDRNVKLLVQMMKVWYTEKHYSDVDNDNGGFDEVAMHSDSIPKRLKIRVTAESTVQLDKIQMANVAMGGAKLGFIDPLSFWEVMGGGVLPSPRKITERLMKFKTDPAGYLGDAEKDEFDRKAFADLQVLLAGKDATVPNDAGLEYMNYFRKFVMSGEFRDAKGKIKNAILDHMNDTNQVLQDQLQMEQSQTPPPQPSPVPGMQHLAGQPGGPGAPPPGDGSQAPPPPMPSNIANTAAVSAQAAPVGGSDPNAVV